ncbi:MAG: phosphatidate cytidylyltransferase [Nitrospirae bacterium]|nr:MAG: phosphatidate cytidylyltransferase [Nitrospirota bacterium]
MSREIDQSPPSSSRPPAEWQEAPPRRLDPRRLYPALVFIPLFFALVQYLPPMAFVVFVCLAASFALWEFYTVYFGGHVPRSLLAFGLLGLATLFVMTDRALAEPLLAGCFLLTVATLLGFLINPAYFKDALPRSLASVLGICYIGGCLAHLVLIRQLPAGPELVFFVIVTTWLADTGAYYVGVLAGRTPLAPWISPRKTVEGLFGGMLAAVAAALLCIIWFVPELTLLDGLLLGLVLTIVGLMGDLAESVFKRLSGVKDSSGLIPGHGGVLDRLDSLLLTAPSFYYYVVLVKHSPAL